MKSIHKIVDEIIGKIKEQENKLQQLEEKVQSLEGIIMIEQFLKIEKGENYETDIEDKCSG